MMISKNCFKQHLLGGGGGGRRRSKGGGKERVRLREFYCLQVLKTLNSFYRHAFDGHDIYKKRKNDRRIIKMVIKKKKKNREREKKKRF